MEAGKIPTPQGSIAELNGSNFGPEPARDAGRLRVRAWECSSKTKRYGLRCGGSHATRKGLPEA